MPDEANNFLLRAKEALEAKQYAKAEALQREACGRLQKEQTDPLQLAGAIETLANIHCIQRKFDLSANEYEEVVRIRERIVPANDYGILQPLFGLAKSHFENQKYEEAEKEMRKLVFLSKTHTGAAETLAFSYHELGFLLYFMGKHDEAEPLLLEALSISDSGLGTSHPQTVRILSAIGMLYANSDLGKDPEPYFKRVIDACKSDPELEESYLVNLWRLAEYLNDKQRLDEADDFYTQLVNLLDATKHENTACISSISSSCAKYFQARGKGEVANHLVSNEPSIGVYRRMVTERLAHAEETLPEDDPEFAEALMAAGNNELFEGRLEEAEHLLQRGLTATRKIHGERGSQTLIALNRLSVVKRCLKKFAEADEAIQQALAIAKTDFRDHGVYPWTIEGLALLREAESRFAEATEAFALAVAEHERILGFPSYSVAEGLYHQSGYLYRIGELRSADAAIRRVISVMDSVPEITAGEKSDYLATLALILNAMGRSSEATKMRSRADALLQETDNAYEKEE